MKPNAKGEMRPSTIAEYIELCVRAGGADSEAVQLLEEWAAKDGFDLDSEASVPYETMLKILGPGMRRPRTDGPLLRPGPTPTQRAQATDPSQRD